MAKDINLLGRVALLIDAIAQGEVQSDTARAVAKVSRSISTVGAAAVEASFLPSEITDIDFLFVRPTGSNILLRTEAAGSQYNIPDGGFFTVQRSSGDVTDILITGGTGAAEVQIIVAQE